MKTPSVQTPAVPDRRRLFEIAGGGALALLAGQAGAAEPPPEADFPRCKFVYEAKVLIGPTERVGEVAAGDQRLIPITGGSFEGPGIRGSVVPGSADWNLHRRDGVTSVSAAYFLKTDDGVIIKIVNQGVNPPPAAGATPARPSFTIPAFEAPEGRYDWLNKGVFVGTLTGGAPGSVKIRVFQLV